jgi:hypothetical protein
MKRVDLVRTRKDRETATITRSTVRSSNAGWSKSASSAFLTQHTTIVVISYLCRTRGCGRSILMQTLRKLMATEPIVLYSFSAARPTVPVSKRRADPTQAVKPGKSKI